MAIMLESPLVIETDEDLVRVGRENAGYRFWRANGGFKRAEALGRRRDNSQFVGGRVADSNTGAIGPTVRILWPDASWVSSERIASPTQEQRATFWPISPDVVIDVRSQSDTFAETIAKVDSFVARGTTYAVAIDPFTREVVTRGTPLSGLSLDLDAIVDA